MAEATQKRPPRFTSGAFLGTLVALLSILTALVAYHGTIAGGAAGGFELEGIRALTESNTAYVAANQNILFDFRQYDSWVVAEDEDKADYLASGFSSALVASMERAEGPFDPAYFDEQFAFSDELYSTAESQFEQAERVERQANRLQLVTLVFAIALSFAAWASLAEVGARIRQVFALLASATLALGLLTYAAILGLSLLQFFSI